MVDVRKIVGGLTRFAHDELPSRLRREAEKTIDENFFNNADGRLVWELKKVRPSDFPHIDDLMSDEGYARRVDEIARSLQAEGQKNPIFVGPNGIEGNGRLGAARKLGMPELDAWVSRIEPDEYAEGGKVGRILGGLSSLVKGKPSTVKIPGVGEVPADRIPAIDDAAERYMRKIGRPGEHVINEYPEHDPEFARRIADEYDRMKHDPADPRVKRSYDALIDETLAQYEALKGSGLEFKFLKDGMADPYARSPSLGYLDLQRNGRLWVFPTDQGYGTLSDINDNPLLKRVGKVGDLSNATANDAFRVVHDAYGHFGPGNPFFRAAGEDRAWMNHSRMYGPEARGAMTSETRGQNSWVNYGPAAERNKGASGADTVYADQKAGLMPEWTMELTGKATGGLARYAEGGKVGRAVAKLPSWLNGALRVKSRHLDHVAPDAQYILDPEEYGLLWRRGRVPLDQIDVPNPDHIEQERIEAIRQIKSPHPAILQFDPNTSRATLLDGAHRMALSRERGLTDIDAVVGYDPRDMLQKAAGGHVDPMGNPTGMDEPSTADPSWNGGELFDRARANYRKFPNRKYPDAIEPREESWRDKAATAALGDRPSPERRKMVEGMIGSTGAGGRGYGLLDFTPYAWGPALAADLLGPGGGSDPVLSTEESAADTGNLGFVAYQMRNPIKGGLRLAKKAITSKPGAAIAAGAATAGFMEPDEAQAGFGGLRRALRGSSYNFNDIEQLNRRLQHEGPAGIWGEKGLMKGPDGLWRFEIDDSKAKIKDLPSLSGSSRLLTEYIDHPELFDQYPDLLTMPIVVDPPGGNYRGYYSAKTPKQAEYIGLVAGDHLKDERSTKSLLLHEIQHAIQNREGFAPGSNPMAAGRQMRRDLIDILKGSNNAPPEAANRANMIMDALDDMPERYSGQVDRGAYQRFAGEAEARNVEARMDMEPHERRHWMGYPENSQDVNALIVPGRSPELNMDAYQTIIGEVMKQKQIDAAARRASRGYEHGGSVSALDELMGMLEGAQ